MLRTHMYRTLLKLGRKFDRNPRYKALIFSSEARFPTAYELDEDMEIVIEQNVDHAMKQLVDSVCSPGIFYKPSVSLESVIRKGFREPLPVELTNSEKTQLGFMAVRLLFNCEKLANELCSTTIESLESKDPGHSRVQAANVAVEPAPVSADNGPLERAFSSNVPLLKEVTKLEPGVLLVSHPTCVQQPLSNAVILVTYVSDDHCSGIILNKEFKERFKGLLAKKERIRYGSFLKEFYDCPCFNGGEGEFDRALNFCIVHQRHELAQYSLKIDLNGGFNSIWGDTEKGQHLAGEETVGDRENIDLDGSADGKNGFVYISYDFQNIGQELAKGTVSKKDLKIIRGITDWTDGELPGAIDMHRLFMVRPAAHVAPSVLLSPDQDQAELSTAPGAETTLSASGVIVERDVNREKSTLIADIIMSRPMPAGYTAVDLGASGGWADPELWMSGHYSWCKALYYMGGEYQDLACMHRLITSERANTYVSILRHLTDYGRRFYPEGSSYESGDDSDFDDEDIAALTLLDEDGHAAGAMLVKSREYIPSDDDEEDFSEFSDDDDDEHR